MFRIYLFRNKEKHYDFKKENYILIKKTVKSSVKYGATKQQFLQPNLLQVLQYLLNHKTYRPPHKALQVIPKYTRFYRSTQISTNITILEPESDEDIDETRRKRFKRIKINNRLHKKLIHTFKQKYRKTSRKIFSHKDFPSNCKVLCTQPTPIANPSSSSENEGNNLYSVTTKRCCRTF